MQAVDWYKEHKAERDAMRKQCHDNRGQLAADPNYINADKAQAGVDAAQGNRIKMRMPLS